MNTFLWWTLIVTGGLWLASGVYVLIRALCIYGSIADVQTFFGSLLLGPIVWWKELRDK